MLAGVIAKDPNVKSMQVVRGTAQRWLCDADTDLDQIWYWKNLVQLSVKLKKDPNKKMDLSAWHPDDSFSEKIYHHGVQAVWYGDGAEGNIKKLLHGIGNGEICACDQEYIGRVGVDVKGEVTLASINNLFSERYSSNGHRFFETAKYGHYLYTNNVNKPVVSVYDSDMGHHSEFWVKNPKVVGLWVVKGSDEERLAKKIAEENNLPLELIDQPTVTYAVGW